MKTPAKKPITDINHVRNALLKAQRELLEALEEQLDAHPRDVAAINGAYAAYVDATVTIVERIEPK